MELEQNYVPSSHTRHDRLKRRYLLPDLQTHYNDTMHIAFFSLSASFLSSLPPFLSSLPFLFSYVPFLLSYFNFSASSFFFFLSSNSISEKSSAVRALTPVILLVHFFEIAASSSGAARISERSSGINPAGTNGFTIGEASVGDI